MKIKIKKAKKVSRVQRQIVFGLGAASGFVVIVAFFATFLLF